MYAYLFKNCDQEARWPGGRVQAIWLRKDLCCTACVKTKKVIECTVQMQIRFVAWKSTRRVAATRTSGLQAKRGTALNDLSSVGAALT